MADLPEAFYFFEFDRGLGKHGRPLAPGRTRWRMTLAYAATNHPDYRPILSTAEFRQSFGQTTDFNPPSSETPARLEREKAASEGESE